MTRKDPSATQDIIAPARPSMIDRLRFFGNLHVTAIIALISLMVGLGGAIAIMPMIDPSPRLLAVLVSLLMGLGIAMMALTISSLILAFDRTATARDIAAALAAATSHERPILLAKIADRTAARFPPTPMTTFDLILLFRGVREEHGTKAHRRHLAEQEAHREQASAIERLSIR
jgi:hypothetical protein